MPLFGAGIVPSGGTNSLGQELNYITRRAFVPKLVVQLWNCSPLVSALLANAQPATGGVSSITQPTQVSQYVNAQWTGYDGSFMQPTPQPGTVDLEFNLKGLIIPIPYLGFEGLLQADHAIINRLEAVFNDAGNVYCDTLASALFNNATAGNNNLQLIGLPGAVDDGTNSIIYGNQSRITYPVFKAKRANAGNVNPTRLLINNYIVGLFKQGSEKPSFGIMGPATWATLAQDFIANERFEVLPGTGFDSEVTGIRSSFTALNVMGVPIYMDPYMPEGSLYLLNTGYMSFYIHEKAAFNFTGFESALPNYQLGSIGAVVSLLELVCTKPKCQAIITGFTYASI